MNITIKRLKKGEWERYRHIITRIECNAFTRKERTNKWVFRELIDKYTPYTSIFYYGKQAVGYYMAATLEDSAESDEFKRIDRQFGKHNTLYLFSIGVLREYQNIGIGRVMMNDLLKVGGRKFRRISFHSKNKNFRRLAFKLGFRIITYTFLDGYKMGYMAKWIRRR